MTAHTIPGEHPTCIGGRRCICDRGIEHEHCICSVTTCECHAAAAYRMELTHDGSGREFYVPTGTRLAPRKRGGA